MPARFLARVVWRHWATDNTTSVTPTSPASFDEYSLQPNSAKPSGCRRRSDQTTDLAPFPSYDHVLVEENTPFKRISNFDALVLGEPWIHNHELWPQQTCTVYGKTEHLRRQINIPAHPYIAIFELSGLSTIGWCPQTFVIIALTVQKLSCWQMSKQTDIETRKRILRKIIQPSLRGSAGDNHTFVTWTVSTWSTVHDCDRWT